MASDEINENNKRSTQDLYAGTTAYNANEAQIDKALARLNTIFLAKIVSCSSSGTGGAKTVKAIPLIAKTDANGNAQPVPTYIELPHYRVQAGVAAVIVDPVPGDIGVFVVCTRDISKVNSQTDSPQVPNSFRSFSPADAVMIATIHTKAPTTYVHLMQDGSLEIKGPASVIVNTPKATINASGSMTVNSPESTFNGHVTITGGLNVSGGEGATVDGSFSATGDVKAGEISLNSHVHSGVQSGGSNTGGPQ